MKLCRTDIPDARMAAALSARCRRNGLVGGPWHRSGCSATLQSPLSSRRRAPPAWSPRSRTVFAWMGFAACHEMSSFGETALLCYTMRCGRQCSRAILVRAYGRRVTALLLALGCTLLSQAQSSRPARDTLRFRWPLSAAICSGLGSRLNPPRDASPWHPRWQTGSGLFSPCSSSG